MHSSRCALLVPAPERNTVRRITSRRPIKNIRRHDEIALTGWWLMLMAYKSCVAFTAYMYTRVVRSVSSPPSRVAACLYCRRRALALTALPQSSGVPWRTTSHKKYCALASRSDNTAAKCNGPWNIDSQGGIHVVLFTLAFGEWRRNIFNWKAELVFYRSWRITF